MDAEESVALVNGALAGDRHAQERLVAALTPVIQARVARKLLARRWGGAGRDIRQQVEDLTQEVFLALFVKDGRELRRWQAERGLSLENFVGMVAGCQAVSFLRSPRRNPRHEQLANGEEFDLPRDEPGPERIVTEREQFDLLLDQMREHLSPLGFHLFLLLYVQQLSVQETMAATGLSDDAVYAWRSRLSRLAEKLMRKMSGNGN